MKKVISTLSLALALTLAAGSVLPDVAQASSHGTSLGTGHAAGVHEQEAAHVRSGFVTRMEDGRLWVFLPGSKELASFDKHGELAKHIVRPGGGPGGITLKAPDAETADAYMHARPGFVTSMEHGRLWVFREGSKELQSFSEQGEMAKHIVRPGGGPGGVTLKAPDVETADAYMAGQ